MSGSRRIKEKHLKENSWKELENRLAEAKVSSAHCRIPICLGFDKELTKHANETDEQFEKRKQRKLQQQRKKVDVFEAVMKGIFEKQHDYTIYLSPKDQKALHDWFVNNAKTVSLIPEDKITDKIILITEWRESPVWKNAHEKHLSFRNTIRELANINVKELFTNVKLLEKAKLMFKLDEIDKIIDRAKLINEDLENNLRKDLEETKHRDNFKKMDDGEIIEHIIREVSDYISWKKILTEDSGPNAEINALIYPYALFKSMKCIDHYSAMFGYTSDTPVHIIPETEEVEVELVSKVQKTEKMDQATVWKALTDVTERLAKESTGKGSDFFVETVYKLQHYQQTTQQNKPLEKPIKSPSSTPTSTKNGNRLNGQKPGASAITHRYLQDMLSSETSGNMDSPNEVLQERKIDIEQQQLPPLVTNYSRLFKLPNEPKTENKDIKKPNSVKGYC